MRTASIVLVFVVLIVVAVGAASLTADRACAADVAVMANVERAIAATQSDHTLLVRSNAPWTLVIGCDNPRCELVPHVVQGLPTGAEPAVIPMHGESYTVVAD